MNYLKHFANRLSSWIYFKTMSEFTLQQSISQLKADDKCLKGHKLKVTGHSCCDDICKCKCGEWFRCGLGSMWKKQ